MPTSNDPNNMTHVVTLRDIYDQGQNTHEAVIRLEGKVGEVTKDVEDVKKVQETTLTRVGSLELDRARIAGMAALIAFVSSGVTVSVGAIIINK